MRFIHDIPELTQARLHAIAQNKPIALIPTMGNLHQGHLSLVEVAKQQGYFTVVSIFVNRLQFLPHEDFDRYPRTLEQDGEKLAIIGTDVVFSPDEKTLYPTAQTYKIQPDPALSDILEGHFRPGFFTGVCTVVMKLLQAVSPQAAFFGEKDFQQLLIIKAMTEQFNLPIQIHGQATVREASGLALSSRNQYLTETQRQKASELYATLVDCQQRLANINASNHVGQQDASIILARAINKLNQKGWQVDYLSLRNAVTMVDISHNFASLSKDTPKRLLVAAKLGTTRLIDNIEII